MKKKVIVATVQVAVVVDSDAAGEAEDTISAIFTENLIQDSVIIDWQYLQKKGFTDPKHIGEIDLDNYEEGDAFKGEA